MSMNFKLT